MTERTAQQITRMKEQTIGVEVEMNHIKRSAAAKIAADFFGTGRYENTARRNGYETYSAWDAQGREWKFQKDVSIAGIDSEKCELVTPILHYDETEGYILDLALRNNRTSEEYPDGIFHPHREYHNIKKENIGLIEVMGLAVLPSRLAEELNAVEEALLSGKDLNNNPLTASHAEWAKEIELRNPDITKGNISDIVRAEVGKVFEQVLLDAGVFKRNESGRQAFDRFLHTVTNGG